MILSYKSHIHDFKRLAIAFFGKPLINYIKIYIAFLLSRYTKKVYSGSFPFALSAELSSICNLYCPECMVGMGKIERKKSFMNEIIFDKLIKDTQGKSFYINLYFQGEPFLNKNIFDFITKSKNKGFYTVLSTNGHFLFEDNNNKLIKSGLDKLLVSLDGLSKETYNYYRINGEYDKVVNGIKNLSKRKKAMKMTHPFIVLQFLVHKKNEHELQYLKSFAKKLGVDLVQIKTMQFYNSETIEEFIPLQEKYRRYCKNSDSKWQVKKKNYKSCFRLWSQLVVTSNGDVVSCCYDKKAEFIVGNICRQSVEEIWKGESINLLRSQLLNNTNLPYICQNCYR